MMQKVLFGLSLAVYLLLAPSTVSAASKVCTVATSSTDDALTIATAFNDCKSGGTVSFPAGHTYYIKSPVTITGLSKVNINFAGTIVLPKYSSSWKNLDHYISIKGDSITLAGNGTINGNGQTWWDIKDTTAPTVLRIGATNSKFGNFNIINSPRAHLGVTGCDGLNLHDVYLHSVSSNSNLPKNTDALDISSSKNVVFQNSVLYVGDDCMAINGGVYNVAVNNVKCYNGHGFSIGSLGKGGKTEVVKNVTITNSVCSNCQNGIRIKTWPGGKGSVSDITFKKVQLVNAQNPIIITTHYCDKNQMSYCKGNDDSSLSISGVTIDGISGNAANNALPIVSIKCSSKTPCTNFSVTGVTVAKSAKTTANVCTYLTGSNKIPYC